MEIYITEDGIKKYPPHKHLHWEIMVYISGEGFLYTPQKSYPFKPGTMILVPPKTIHGSVSENGFKNISIGGKFEDIIVAKAPICAEDNEKKDGTAIAKIIYGNKFSKETFLNSLCASLLCFFTQNISFEDDAYFAVCKCMEKISENAFDTELNLQKILASSGYAEDYIRAKFKEYTGKTPTVFLTEIRIKRAKLLIEIYGKNMLLREIMTKCGFYDYAYFSKKFRQHCGISPREYVKKCETCDFC